MITKTNLEIEDNTQKEYTSTLAKIKSGDFFIFVENQDAGPYRLIYMQKDWLCDERKYAYLVENIREGYIGYAGGEAKVRIIKVKISYE